MNRRSAPHPGASSSTLFDPHQVPVFPRLPVEISTRDRTITIAGTPHHPAPAENLFDAAVTAAASHIRAMKLDHARAVALVDGNRYHLVIGADGQRYNLEPTQNGRHQHQQPTREPQNRTGQRKPVWPILAAAAAIMLIISTSVGVGLAWQQRQQLANRPAAPSTPPRAELPIVPTDAWSTRAAWTIRVQPSPERAAIALSQTSLLVVTPQDTLTAVDPATGITQWSSPIPGGQITAGPVFTTIDRQDVVAVVAGGRLLWWPAAGSAAPIGQVELHSGEEVTFNGTSPLIVRGRLARVIVDGQPADRIIPAGARAVRADAGTVLAISYDGEFWQLTTTDLYAPKPRQLPGITSDNVPVIILGTHEDTVAVMVSNIDPAADYVMLYTPTGEPIGKPILPTGVTVDISRHSPWMVIGTTLINGTTGAHQALPTSWRTERLEQDLYGKVAGRLMTVDPSTGTTTTETKTGATPPLASTTTHAYYVADNNDGEPQLYAVNRQ